MVQWSGQLARCDFHTVLLCTHQGFLPDMQADNRIRVFFPNPGVEPGLVYMCERGNVDLDNPHTFVLPIRPVKGERVTENMPAGRLQEVQSPVNLLDYLSASNLS
jgi:hypothetical protein